MRGPDNPEEAQTEGERATPKKRLQSHTKGGDYHDVEEIEISLIAGYDQRFYDSKARLEKALNSISVENIDVVETLQRLVKSILYNVNESRKSLETDPKVPTNIEIELDELEAAIKRLEYFGQTLPIPESTPDWNHELISLKVAFHESQAKLQQSGLKPSPELSALGENIEHYLKVVENRLGLVGADETFQLTYDELYSLLEEYSSRIEEPNLAVMTDKVIDSIVYPQSVPTTVGYPLYDEDTMKSPDGIPPPAITAVDGTDASSITDEILKRLSPEIDNLQTLVNRFKNTLTKSYPPEDVRNIRGFIDETRTLMIEAPQPVDFGSLQTQLRQRYIDLEGMLDSLKPVVADSDPSSAGPDSVGMDSDSLERMHGVGNHYGYEGDSLDDEADGGLPVVSIDTLIPTSEASSKLASDRSGEEDLNKDEEIHHSVESDMSLYRQWQSGDSSLFRNGWQFKLSKIKRDIGTSLLAAGYSQSEIDAFYHRVVRPWANNLDAVRHNTSESVERFRDEILQAVSAKLAGREPNPEIFRKNYEPTSDEASELNDGEAEVEGSSEISDKPEHGPGVPEDLAEEFKNLLPGLVERGYEPDSLQEIKSIRTLFSMMNRASEQQNDPGALSVIVSRYEKLVKPLFAVIGVMYSAPAEMKSPGAGPEMDLDLGIPDPSAVGPKLDSNLNRQELAMAPDAEAMEVPRFNWDGTTDEKMNSYRTLVGGLGHPHRDSTVNTALDAFSRISNEFNTLDKRNDIDDAQKELQKDLLLARAENLFPEHIRTALEGEQVKFETPVKHVVRPEVVRTPEDIIGMSERQKNMLEARESQAAYEKALDEYYKAPGFRGKLNRWGKEARDIFGSAPKLTPELQALKDKAQTSKLAYATTVKARLAERAKQEGAEVDPESDSTKHAFFKRYVADSARRELALQKGMLVGLENPKTAEAIKKVKGILTTLGKHKWKARIGMVLLIGAIAGTGGAGVAVAAAGFTAGRMAAGIATGALAGSTANITFNYLGGKAEINSNRVLKNDGKNFALEEMAKMEAEYGKALTSGELWDKRRLYGTAAAGLVGGLTGAGMVAAFAPESLVSTETPTTKPTATNPLEQNNQGNVGKVPGSTAVGSANGTPATEAVRGSTNTVTPVSEAPAGSAATVTNNTEARTGGTPPPEAVRGSNNTGVPNTTETNKPEIVRTVSQGDTSLSQLVHKNMLAEFDAGKLKVPEGITREGLAKLMYREYPEMANPKLPVSEWKLTPEQWRAMGVESGNPHLIHEGDNIKVGKLMVGMEDIEVKPASVTRPVGVSKDIVLDSTAAPVAQAPTSDATVEFPGAIKSDLFEVLRRDEFTPPTSPYGSSEWNAFIDKRFGSMTELNQQFETNIQTLERSTYDFAERFMGVDKNFYKSPYDIFSGSKLSEVDMYNSSLSTDPDSRSGNIQGYENPNSEFGQRGQMKYETYKAFLEKVAEAKEKLGPNNISENMTVEELLKRAYVTETVAQKFTAIMGLKN